MDLILLAVGMMVVLTILDRKAWGDAGRRNRRASSRAFSRKSTVSALRATRRRTRRLPGLVICPATQAGSTSGGRWWWE
ncbi:MAG: hypothetical protein ACYC5M_18400 [Anaerolineae bacterium]